MRLTLTTVPGMRKAALANLRAMGVSTTDDLLAKVQRDGYHWIFCIPQASRATILALLALLHVAQYGATKP